MRRKKAGRLARMAPATADAVDRYAHAATRAERRHIMLVKAMRTGLAAQLTMSAQPVNTVCAG